MTLFMKFLHVAAAFWFIGGLVGRTVTMWQASRTPDVTAVNALVRLAGSFERYMVIPGSFAVLGFGLIAAWVGRWPLLGTSGGQSLWLLLSTVLYLSLIPVIALVFVPRGRVFAAALQEATALGSITSALSAAFHDRAVSLAHRYEWAVTAIIVFLMVAKPF